LSTAVPANHELFFFAVAAHAGADIAPVAAAASPAASTSRRVMVIGTPQISKSLTA
jgi:hypothetical protein